MQRRGGRGKGSERGWVVWKGGGEGVDYEGAIMKGH